MAFYTSELDSGAVKPGLLTRFAAWITRGIEVQGQQMSRRDQIEALEAKTDAELAALGIKRDQIAYHVFRDLFYA